MLLKQFILTFGSDGFYPNGHVIVSAKSEIVARLLAMAQYGRNWCGLYSPEDQFYSEYALEDASAVLVQTEYLRTETLIKATAIHASAACGMSFDDTYDVLSDSMKE